MEGRVVAITGGASGIGLSTAQLVASLGAKVSVADVRQQQELDKALTSIRKFARSEKDVLICGCDVRNAPQVSAWLQTTVDKWGHLDHVANIAGTWSTSRIEDIVEQDWDMIMDVNLKGTMHVLRESLKLMPNNAGCSIVAVASICGLQGYAEQAAYSASKHGVVGLVRCAAKELGTRGIRVNCVAPGVVDTPLARAGPGEEFLRGFCSRLPISRPAESSEIAQVIAFLLGSDSSFVTGSVYTVDGGCLC